MDGYSFDLHRIFIGETPLLLILEIFLRTGIMYAYALFLLRLFLGKRAIAQLSGFELVIIIAFGGATGDPMINPALPLLHGMLVLTFVVVLHKTLILYTNRNETAERILEDTDPVRLVVDGRLDLEGMDQAELSRAEIFTELRQSGVEQLGQVKRLYLELNGSFSVFLYPREQMKPGLSILPPEQLRDEDELLKDAVIVERGIYACHECGHATAFDQGATLPSCPNCGKSNWERAVIGIATIESPV